MSSVRYLSIGVALTALVLVAPACRETGTIRVHSLKFNGVHGVDVDALRSALATKTSSKLPWGTKRFFDRTQFETDLKRLTAFYSDHGYPRARITNFDVKLNQKQDAVDLTLTIDEGAPIIVRAVDYKGFETIPERRMNAVKRNAPVKVGEPRNKAFVLTTQEAALNALRDNGYPYAKVNVDEDDGPGGLNATLTIVGEPGKIAYFGPTTVQ